MEQSSTNLPKQFQGLAEMGNFVELYPAKTSTGIRAGLMTVFFLLGAGALINGTGIFLSRSGEHLPAVLDESVPWLLGGLLAMVLALLFMRGLRGSARRAAIVFEHGFAYSDRKGVQAWRWEQVQDVSAAIVRHYLNKRHTRTTQTYTFANTAGEQILVDDSLGNVASFFSHVQNNTLQLRYQRLADRYNLGEIVQFGPVSIGKKLGIKIGKQAYHWDQIGEAAIQEGVLTIKKKDGKRFRRGSVKAGEVPNLHVLLSIIHQVIGLKTGA